jgi:hypothetical protein
VTHGDADPIASFTVDRQLYDFSAGAPKAFVDIVGGGHLPPYVDGGTQPDVVRATIDDFLDSQLRGDPAGTSRLFVDGNQPGLTSLSTDGLSTNPIGAFESASPAGNQAVHLTGWAIDPDTDGPDPVQVFVDGRPTAILTASASRPDIAATYPSFSTQHGLDDDVRVATGTHIICVNALNVGAGDSDTFLGCRSVTVVPLVVGTGVVGNADGRLEAFAVQADHTLRHIFQTTPGGGWSQWYAFSSISLTGRVEVAANGDGRLEVFGVGTDGQLWHAWQQCAGCGWSDWFPLGGQWQPDRFSVAANVDGRLEVFAVGVDGSLQHDWQSNGWSGWFSLTPPWSPSPSATVAGVAAARQTDGRLAVTAVDPAGRLVVDVQAGPGFGWSPWQALATGGIAGAPVLGVNADRRLEVFAVGSDHRLWHAFQNNDGSWSTIGPLSGSFDAASALAVADNEDQRLEVFGSAPTSHAIVHVWQGLPNQPFGAVVPLGGTGTNLAAASNPDGRVELFTMTPPVTHAFQVAPNSGWSTFYGL